MKAVSKIALVIVSLLSLAAGLAKLMLVPQEVRFFAEIGLGNGSLQVLGAAQMAGGVFALIPRFRLFGLLLVALGFFVSLLAILMMGDAAFAAVSSLPILVSVWLVVRERSARRPQ